MRFIHRIQLFDGRTVSGFYSPTGGGVEGGKNGAIRVTGILRLPLSVGRVSADNPIVSITRQNGERLIAHCDIEGAWKLPNYWWHVDVSGLIPLPTSEQLFAIVDARGRAFTDASGRVLLARNE